MILYDSRFPYLEAEPGSGMYFAEGVIAAIEVKSTLTKPILKEALDNCLSVMELPIHFDTREQELGESWCARIVRERGLSLDDATHAMKWEMIPRTYIFAFSTRMRPSAIGNVVAGWYDARGESATPYIPYLPRLISAPRTVGLQDDSWIAQDLGDNLVAIRRDHGPQARAVMPFYPTRRHFGWLALHLIHAVDVRFGVRFPGSGMRLPIEQYLPVNQYGRELWANNEPSTCVVWSGNRPIPPGA